MFLSIFLLFIIFLITLSFFVGTYNENYWKKRGAVYFGGKNMAAIFWEFALGLKSLYVVFGEVYTKYKDEPAVGIASFLTPALFVIHPDNILHVTTENFKAFYHRGIELNENDKLAQNVLFLNGPRWKITRQKMTPLFTSAKLKNMYYIVDKSAQDFVEYLKNNLHNKKLNAFDEITLFCCASLGASIFGVKKDESTFKSPFLGIAKEALKPSLKANLRFMVNSVSPTLFKILGMKLFSEHEKKFIGAISYVLKERELENVKKHDFPDLALEIKKNGKLRDEETGTELDPTDELLAAQAFFFLIAGAEPTASGIFGSLFELAKRPDILKRVHAEVDDAFKKTGQIGYNDLINMPYLDKVLEEALRMHPPVSMLGRRCTANTVLPVGNIKVSKGTQIHIPILALHHDPKYYPNPEVFDPERFSQEEIEKRPKVTFMPFGEGGRLCIGQRYAYLQMKSGLVHLLRNFNVKLDDVNKKMTYLKTPLIVRPTHDVNFYFVPRN